MKASFALKLGFVITFLSVSLTSGSVYYFYKTTYNTVMEQVGQNLLTLGRLGSTLFDEEARAAIKRLILASERGSMVTVEQIEAMVPFSTLESLPKDKVQMYHGSADFQKLRNILSIIGLASIQDMEPPQKNYTHLNPLELFNQGVVGAYLAVAIKESPNNEVNKYLVSAAPDPTPDGWPGNPIGNLFKGDKPQSFRYKGVSCVDKDWFTDEFYTSIIVTVPILNKDGTTLAILGLDYIARQEQNVLKRLSYLCFALILLSFFLSVFVSYYFSKRLSSPLIKLYDAAERVRERDFDVEVDINSKDEFALLGQSFNQMVSSTRSWTKVLIEKNAQLTTVIHDMHDGVGAILTSLVMATGANEPGDSKTKSINRLAQQGLSEVRFLMNSVDSYDYSYQTLLEEIELLAQDIISSAGLAFSIHVSGTKYERNIPFVNYLNLQRIFRESFVNIVRHSRGTECRVDWRFGQETINIQIQDNGVGQQGESSTGRGLISIASRVKGLGGEFETFSKNGLNILITLPSTQNYMQ